MWELVEITAAAAFGLASIVVAGRLVRNPPKPPPSRPSMPSFPDGPFSIDPGGEPRKPD